MAPVIDSVPTVGQEVEAVSEGGLGLVDASLLDELTKDFKRIKQQKARPTGGIEGRVMLNLAFLGREHYVDYQNKGIYAEQRDPNKLYLSLDLIGPRFYKLIGRLSAFNAPFKAKPDKKDPKAQDEAEVVDRLIAAIEQKLDGPSRLREILFWMGAGGTAFVLTTWVPNATIETMPVMSETGEPMFKAPDGNILPESQVKQLIAAGAPPESFTIHEEVTPTGDIGCEVLGPLNVFIDQSVRGIDDLAPDQWIHVAKIRTLGWVEETFGTVVEPDKDISIVSTQFHQTGGATGGTFLKDLIPLVQGSTGPEDPGMVVVVESYQPRSKKNPHGRYACWVPGKTILHAGDNPYEDIPVVDFHWKPVTTSFWTPDYVSALISPQRFINKRFSQLGEQSNASIYSQLLLGPGIKRDDIPTDTPGVIEGAVSEQGIPLVQRMEPPALPSWFMQSIELTLKMFNDIAGGADLFQESKFPGQIRGPMAVPMLQEILDTEWGPLFEHLGERLARVHQQRLNRVKQFYPPQRTLHYTDRDQRDEVLNFHKAEILEKGTNFNITVERGALIPELRALSEARVRERLQSPLGVLYLDERTGKLDKSKIAADLKFGDIGRESREGQYRKLAGQIIDMLWKAEQVPPPLPFYDHAVMLDELEASMATTEFLRASPQVQQLFLQRWEQHRFYLQQEAMAQQQAMQSGMIQNAVAQATQQAAAMAAADAVTSTNDQMAAQRQQPTEEFVRSAQERSQPRPQAGPAKPAPPQTQRRQ